MDIANVKALLIAKLTYNVHHWFLGGRFCITWVSPLIDAGNKNIEVDGPWA